MPEIVNSISIDVTTKATAKKSRLIHKKHLVIEALRGNTGKIYIGLSYEYTGAGRLETDFEPIKQGEIRFYGSPPQKEINYIWYYAENSGDGFNYVASDGAITRPNFRGDIRLAKFIRKKIETTLVSDTGKTEIHTVPSGKRWLVVGGWIHNGDSVQRECDVSLFAGGSDICGYFSYTSGLTAGDKKRFPKPSEDSQFCFAPNMYPIICEAGDIIRFLWAKGGASDGGACISFLEYFEVDMA